MNQREFASIMVRLFAFYLILLCVGQVQQIVMYLLYPHKTADPDIAWMALGAGANLAVSLLVAALLLARTGTAVRWVLPAGAAPGSPVELPGRDLTTIAFSLAGLVFLVLGLEKLVGQSVACYLSPADRYTGIRSAFGFDTPGMIGAAFKAAIGLWLLLGAGGVVRLARRARGLRGMEAAQADHEGDA